MRNRDSCGAGQVVEGVKGELEHFEGEVTADGRRV